MSNNNLSFKDLAKLVTEDMSAMSDKWATGLSGRFKGPSQYTLVDLLKKQDEQHPNFTKAPKGMPHSMQTLIELLGDVVVRADECGRAFDLASENPVLIGKDKSRAQLASMRRKIGHVKQIIKSIADDVDNFSIDNSQE
jgi:hypothetical protein